MPNWLISFLIAELEKYVTPELLKRLEHQAAQFVCCKLKVNIAALPDGAPKDAAEAALAIVAASLSIDLGTCPA